MSARVAVRLAFARRRQAAEVKACLPSSRARRPESPVVLCDRDPDAKPLIPRKWQDAASIVGSVILLTAWIIACAFFGGVQ